MREGPRKKATGDSNEITAISVYLATHLYQFYGGDTVKHLKGGRSVTRTQYLVRNVIHKCHIGTTLPLTLRVIRGVDEITPVKFGTTFVGGVFVNQEGINASSYHENCTSSGHLMLTVRASTSSGGIAHEFVRPVSGDIKVNLTKGAVQLWGKKCVNASLNYFRTARGDLAPSHNMYEVFQLYPLPWIQLS